MTGSELAAITGLTSGAIAGVVARLDQGRYLRRDAHPADARKQALSAVPDRQRQIHELFAPLRDDMAALLQGFNTSQLDVIAEFLTRGTELAYRQIALGADALAAPVRDSAPARGRPR